MLKLAKQYEDELKKIWLETWMDDKYKFFYPSSWRNSFSVSDDTWQQHQFVSVQEEKIIGYIGYSIDRETNSVNSLAIINFTKKSLAFGRDLKVALRDIFFKYHFHKLTFTVICGNPIEHQYDRLIEKHGGRIVGVYRDDVRLMDGNLYHQKLYEILASDLIK